MVQFFVTQPVFVSRAWGAFYSLTRRTWTMIRAFVFLFADNSQRLIAMVKVKVNVDLYSALSWTHL